jgi:leader peptidase (prepilin peptidase)/N-methyltransferase
VVTGLLAVFLGLIGLAVGSFLNVVAWRVPRKESLTTPRSHCPSCSTQLANRDNVPLVSWALLRGRCRTCQASISARYPLVELTCALLFAATAVHFGLSYALPAYLVLAAGLVALSVIDFEHKLLPNRIVYPTGITVGILLSLAALAEDEPRRIAWALAGALGSFAMFFLLHFAYPQGMAFGDVRLSFVLGMAVGWIDLWQVPLFLFVSFLVSAAFGLVYAAVSRKGLKAAIPFGPFLALGAEVAVFAGGPLVDAYIRR